jgi:hypothetical protein
LAPQKEGANCKFGTRVVPTRFFRRDLQHALTSPHTSTPPYHLPPNSS